MGLLSTDGGPAWVVREIDDGWWVAEGDLARDTDQASSPERVLAYIADAVSGGRGDFDDEILVETGDGSYTLTAREAGHFYGRCIDDMT